MNAVSSIEGQVQAILDEQAKAEAEKEKKSNNEETSETAEIVTEELE